jgi:hypothetical protein
MKNGKDLSFEDVAKRTGLTIEEVKTIRSVMCSTWDYIASDYLELFGRKSIPRSYVVEAVTDADRMTMFHPKELETIKKYYALDALCKDLITKFSFPYSRYGY